MYRLMIIADDGDKRAILTIGGSRRLLLKNLMPSSVMAKVLTGSTAAMKDWPKPCLSG